MSAASSKPPGVPSPNLDLCDPANRDVWMHHPVVGDPSFDAFERAPSNPGYTGVPPYEWPVNGSLFQDPQSRIRYCYVSLYPESYWAKDGTQFGPGKTLLLRSKDEGESWENLGIVLEGDKDSFDGDGQRGGTTLDSMVLKEGNTYHMLYCWAHVSDWKEIGLAYASAPSPEGPFERAPEPAIHPLSSPLRPGNFRDLYEGTLIQRENDWLLLSCIRQNDPPLRADLSLIDWAPFCQALVAMTAPAPQGPWSAPQLLLSPQMPCWQPQPIENGVHWVHDGFVYVSQYSVGSNRSYHVFFRAPLETAHTPAAWEPYRNGSIFHAEAIESEAMGIWGQPLNGYVDSSGRFEIMYPAKDSANRGTINFAACDWENFYKRGFWISGTTAPSLGIVQRGFTDFRLTLEVDVHKLEGGGQWALVWNQRSPVGPEPERAGEDHPTRRFSDESLDGACLLRITGDRWVFEENGKEISSGEGAEKSPLVLKQCGRSVFMGDEKMGETIYPGGTIGLLAAENTSLHVRQFLIEGTSDLIGIRLGALDGLWGAANNLTHWQPETEGFISRIGYSSIFGEARAKWNFYGSRAGLWLPHGPQYGRAEVWLDGERVADLDLASDSIQESSLVWDSEGLEEGLHAVMLLRIDGRLPVDVLEFF